MLVRPTNLSGIITIPGFFIYAEVFVDYNYETEKDQKGNAGK
jgi:hypothetical protein